MVMLKCILRLWQSKDQDYGRVQIRVMLKCILRLLQNVDQDNGIVDKGYGRVQVMVWYK